MWELHTVSINFNYLNNIGMCCTHHVQTYLEEKGRAVTAHRDRQLSPAEHCSPRGKNTPRLVTGYGISHRALGKALLGVPYWNLKTEPVLK